MKVIYENTKVIGTATDAYDGPNSWVIAPDGFDVNKLDQYTMVDGVPTLPSLSVTNKAQAMSLLAATDWTEVPSVTNTANQHHLINAADFVAYRIALRAIAVNPPNTVVSWPTLPIEQWSN